MFLKRSSFFLLAAIVLLEGMSFLLVETAFQWNQKYIVEKLCINRFNTSMHCNGCCYLKDQLQQSASNQASNQKSAPQVFPLVWFIEDQTRQPLTLPEQSLKFARQLQIHTSGFYF